MKIRVGVLFGGKSAEHEVSVQSARNVVDAMDPEKYEVVLIGIDRRGRWRLDGDARALLADSGSDLPALSTGGDRENHVMLLPGNGEGSRIPGIPLLPFHLL